MALSHNQPSLNRIALSTSFLSVVFAFTASTAHEAHASGTNSGSLANPGGVRVVVTDTPESKRVNVANTWHQDVNPSRAFKAPQGTTPAGAGNKAGMANGPQAVLESIWDEPVANVKLDNANPRATITDDAIVRGILKDFRGY